MCSLTVREVNILAGKSTGSGSVTSLKPDSSKQVTRNIKLRGETVARDITRTVHTISDASGRVAVRYSLEDGHNMPILFEDTQKDILDFLSRRNILVDLRGRWSTYQPTPSGGSVADIGFAALVVAWADHAVVFTSYCPGQRRLLEKTRPPPTEHV